MAGTKDDSGKPQVTLFPWGGVEDVTRVMEFGAEKYGRENWMLGFAPHRLEDALGRHVVAWLAGEECAADSRLSHVAHIAANALMILALRKLKPAVTQEAP